MLADTGQRHALALTHLAHGLLSLLASWFALASAVIGSAVVRTLIFGDDASAHAMPSIRLILVTAAFIYVVVSLLLSTATAWGLWRERPWTRAVALVAAVVALPLAPVGTAVAALTFWLLLVRREGEVTASSMRTAADAFR